jgi:hypothetical protein
MKLSDYIPTLKWVACMGRGHRPEFMRNVYGDEIIDLSYARSIFRCTHCGRLLFQRTLHRGANNEPL